MVEVDKNGRSFFMNFDWPFVYNSEYVHILVSHLFIEMASGHTPVTFGSVIMLLV